MRRWKGLRAGFKKVVFALTPLAVLLAFVEIVVRLTGAADTCTSPKQEVLWTCDPVLYFKTNPELSPRGAVLDDDGFREPTAAEPSDDALRILALGDSCTFGVITTPALDFVEEPFPERVAALASADRETVVFNAAAPGYTSYHGVVLLQTKLRDRRPDVILVRFGWNDLFLNHQAPGGDLLREPETAVGRGLRYGLFRSALVRFFIRVRMEHTAAPDPMERLEQMASFGERRPAVPIERFARHLRRIISIGRARGADVWLLTSPHALLMDEYRDDPSVFEGDLSGQGFVDLNLLGSFDHLVEVHTAYMNAIRSVGRDTGATVVDLVRVYERHSERHLFNDADILHENDAGHGLAAAAIIERLRGAGYLSPPAR